MFSASGNGPIGSGFGFGLDAIGLLRGFDEDDVVGTRAAVINVDYRLPLWRIGRGIGTLPVFLRTLHGAVFFDAGKRGPTPSAGATRERLLAAKSLPTRCSDSRLPLTFTAGAAIRRDGTTDRSSVVAFARVGRAF